METAFIIILAVALAISLWFNLRWYLTVKAYRNHLASLSSRIVPAFAIACIAAAVVGFSICKLKDENFTE